MDNNKSSKSMIITGWVLSGLAILMLLADAIFKLIQPQQVIDANLQLGFPQSAISTLGIISLFSIIIYLIPRFSIIGAVLITGFLGGAVATHLRLQNPLFSHILFPVYLGILVWTGLYLRNPGLRKLLSGKSN